MKGKTVFEPVQIGYNEKGCSDKLYKLNNQFNKLNEFRIRFENLGLEWNIETLVDLFNGGVESENLMVRNIQQEVSRISIPGLREKMQRELEDTVMHDFKQLRADVKGAKPDCDTNYLEVSGGAVRLTDEGKKAIKDSFVLWANTSTELELWNEAVEIVDRLKKLDEKLRPSGIYGIYSSEFNNPSLIRLSLSYPKADPFVLEECNDKGTWAGKR